MALPKDVDWRILSHCDGQAVRKEVEYGDRDAMTVLRLRPLESFLTECDKNQKLSKCYQICLKSYRNLTGFYEKQHDTFGGYCLIYTGKEKIMAKTVLPRSPVGFLVPVLDDITDLSVIQKKSSPGISFLMLGPTRFANSSCDPNAEYDFTNEQKVVKLRALKTILQGDEVLVKYSDDFFANYDCLCAKCKLDRTFLAHFLRNLELVLFSELLEEEIADVSLEYVQDCEKLFSTSKFEKPTNRKERLSWSQKVRAFSMAYEVSTPSSSERSTEVSVDVLCSENDIDDFANTGDLHSDSDWEKASSASSETNGNLVRVSSPQSSILFEEPRFSEFASSIASFTPLLSVGESPLSGMTQPLYPGAKVGVHNTNLLLRSFCASLHLSHVGMLKLHYLVNCLIPEENGLLAPNSFVYQMKKNIKGISQDHVDLSQGEVCVLGFSVFLKSILERNLESIFSYSDQKRTGDFVDFPVEKVPCIDRDTNSFTIQLILATDGVSIINSNQIGLWPFWLSIANLPPILRMSRKNIALAALFVGSSKPPWGEIIPKIEKELSKTITVEYFAVLFDVRFEVIGIVADLIAKCSLLNMIQHNGFFGCNYCTIEGVTINRTHSYYPFDQSFEIRKPEINDKYVALAEALNTSSNASINVCGVKGRSAFHGLVADLPLSAGIDYMHCVLLGCFQEILKFFWKLMSTQMKNVIAAETNRMRAPLELVKHGRNIRDLFQIANFKANEYFNYLLFLSPIIFKDRLSDSMYNQLLYLVFGIRLLLESNDEKEISIAERLLDMFCRNITSVYQCETAETINVHCLRHLAHQCRSFGPLFVFSAMSFESANRILSQCFSGTHSHCAVI